MSIIANLIERVTPLGLVQYFWGQPGTQDVLTANNDAIDALIAHDRTRLDVLEAGGTQTTWQPSQFEVVAANRTAQAGDWLFVDTSVSARTITLPASPSVTNGPIWLADAASSWGTNAVTVARNGELIEGSAADYVLDIDDASVILAYVGGSIGWRVLVYEQGPNIQALSVEIKDSSGFDSARFRHAGSNLATDFENTNSWDVQLDNLASGVTFTDGGAGKFVIDKANTRVEIRDGWSLRVNEPDDTTYFQVQHFPTNTDVRVAGTGVAHALNISEYSQVDLIGGTSLRIRDGANFEIRDFSDSDVALFAHNGVDFNTSFGGTTEWNILDVPLHLAQGSLYLTEKASAGSDTAGRGQLWPRDDAPNTLVFTDDAGNDFEVSNSVPAAVANAALPRPNTTTRTVDSALTVSAPKTGYYEVDFFLSWGTLGLGGIVVELAFSGTAAGRLVAVDEVGNTSIVTLDGATFSFTGANASGAISIRGYMDVTAVGDLQVLWAQQSANATPTNREAGSFNKISFLAST